jgi:hypothetical protein
MCTFGELKIKMCFAFRQMINTRSIKKFAHFHELTEGDLNIFCNKYESLYQEGIFKNNYERTLEVRNSIANGVSKVNTGKVWCNNGLEEKFVDKDTFDNVLKDNWTLGRLKNNNISNKLKGKKHRTREELLEEFEYLVKTKDDKKRIHVHFKDRESYLTGKRIAESNIPWEFGRKHLPNKPEGMTDNEYLNMIRKNASQKAAEKNRGKHWYTNGIVNILSDECPEGFYLGKTTKK